MKFHTVHFPGVMLSASVFFANVFALALLQFVGENGSWEAFTPATCLATSCFCERPRDSLMRQPANSWSNLAFTFVGSMVGLEALAQDIFYKPRAPIKKREHQLALTFGTLFALSNFILGFGSGWYHASLTLLGQFMDNFGMYLVVVSPALFSLSALRRDYSAAQYVVEYCVINVVLGCICYVLPFTRRHIFAGLIVVGIFCEMLARKRLGIARTQRTDLRIIGVGVIVFAAAFAIWIADSTKYLCDPDSLFQGHAVWHFLTATSSYVFYLYYHPIAFTHETDSSMCSVV